VEHDAVEVVALGEGGEVLACLWRMVIVKFDDDGALSWSVRAICRCIREQHTIVVSSATSVAMVKS
jgi:hypothetical protein